MTAIEPAPARSRLPIWMVVVGALLAAVGIALFVVSRRRADQARLISIVNTYEGGRLAESASALSHWGLGLLIAGAVIALVGVTVAALKPA